VLYSNNMPHSSNWGSVVVALSLLGCGGDEGPRGADGTSDTQGRVTYHRDVRPLLERHCSGCHTEGGIGAFSVAFDEREWQDGAPAWAALAVSAVETRTMPPWMPAEGCRDIDPSRRLSDAEIAVFTGWRDAAFAVGQVADYVAPVIDRFSLSEPTLVVQGADAYTPRADVSDDYRCFILPQVFEQESYLIATTVEPDAIDQVHHVILFSADAAAVRAAAELDGAEAGPGYTCYGSPKVSAANIGGWVPGQVPNVTPEGSARVLPAQSQIIMQVHYNNDHVADETIEADRTRAKLWLLKDGDKPKYRITTVPLANTEILIPVEDDVVQTKTFSAPLEGTIVGVLPHMHQLGKRISVSFESGGDEQCVIDIPAWDFHWQQGYRFSESAFLEVKRGDSFELTCVYDNAKGDGVVRWGEGTSDEMCLNYLEVRTPFAGPTLEEACPTYHACIDACAENDAGCLRGCSAQTPECIACTSPGIARCAPGYCPSEGLAVQGCVRDCMGDQGCVRTMCGELYDAFFLCMEPALREGTCDTALASCGT
jgi:hypothetical protein